MRDECDARDAIVSARAWLRLGSRIACMGDDTHISIEHPYHLSTLLAILIITIVMCWSKARRVASPKGTKSESPLVAAIMRSSEFGNSHRIRA